MQQGIKISRVTMFYGLTYRYSMLKLPTNY